MNTNPDDLCSGNSRVIYGPENHVRQDLGIGLTKREHFAAIAMQGCLSGAYGIEALCSMGPQQYANTAVQMADALIEALNHKFDESLEKK